MRPGRDLTLQLQKGVLDPLFHLTDKKFLIYVKNVRCATEYPYSITKSEIK